MIYRSLLWNMATFMHDRCLFVITFIFILFCKNSVILFEIYRDV